MQVIKTAKISSVDSRNKEYPVYEFTDDSLILRIPTQIYDYEFSLLEYYIPLKELKDALEKI